MRGDCGESICSSNAKRAGQVELPPQTYYVDRYIAAKNERPVIDARAKQYRCQKSTHKVSRFYHDIMLPCYHGKVNAHVNIHAACECCHVTVVKHKARQNARCARQTGKASGKSPVNGHRRPYKRTQGATGMNIGAKEKALQNRS